jgi:CoA:oxalate CoA-transferase
VSGFGQTGPESHRPAYDIILQAMCGLMDATGAPDGTPTMLGEAVSDAVRGLFASWGVLAALLAREKTGRGTHIDVSMFDATLSLSATLVARYAATGLAPRRVGNRHPSSAPFGVYRAADGFYVVAVLNNKLFQALANAIGRPEMAQDPRFADDETRCRFEGDLCAVLEAWSASFSVAEVNRLLSEASIPVAPIRNVKEALESDHAAHRGLLTEVAEAEGGTVRLPSQPVKFSGYGANRVTPAPALGQHTEAILAELANAATAHPQVFSKEKQHA